MDKMDWKAMLSMLGGFGMMYFASQDSELGSFAEVKDPKKKTKKKPASIEDFEKWKEKNKKKGKGRAPGRQQRQVPNPQRYNVYLDIIERHTDPGMPDGDMMLMLPQPGLGAGQGIQPGRHFGHVRTHNHICIVNENDPKWDAMCFAGDQNIINPVTVNLNDILAQGGGNNIAGHAVMMVGIPTTARSLEDQVRGMRWKTFGEYASFGDALQNYNAIFGPVTQACADPEAPYRDLFDI